MQATEEEVLLRLHNSRTLAFIASIRPNELARAGGLGPELPGPNPV
jgi:hypothetical protein